MAQSDGARPGLTGPVLVTAAGLLAMVVAGVAAQQYTPFWFDPDEGCALHDRCPGPAADAALSALWALATVGLAVVLAGTALIGRRLGETPRPAPDRPLPGWGVVAAGAIAATAVSGVLGWVVLVGVLTSAPAAAAALCLLWLAQAVAVTAVELRARPSREDATMLPAWLTGLAVSAVAVASLVGWAFVARSTMDVLPAVDGAAVASGLLVRRAVLAGARPAPVALGALVVAGAAAAVLVATSGALGTGGPAVPTLPPLRPAAPPPPPAPTAPPSPGPAPTPPAPVVDADVACRPADLQWHVTGWDSAMGTRSAVVVATSSGGRPCYVDGFARITLSQGGREVRLTTGPGSATSSEVPQPRRVGLAPGGSAWFPLLWKGYGAAADAESPQELRVTLAGGGGPDTVPLGASAPFDLVDGGTIRIGAWQPGVP